MDRNLSLDALPEPLRERSRELRGATPGDGDFILYWTHHALRASENPALDVAVWAGNRLGLPVLVYQGLGAGHRFDSDRHHTFILEGAADLAGALGRRGIAYRLFAPRGKSPSPLRDLARRAALTVVEDFPAPPFPRWTRRLAAAVDGPVWCVDAACAVPMQSFGRAFDRAFQFRDRAWQGMLERAQAGSQDIEPEVDPWDGKLDFDAVDPRELDIPSFVAECDIDHSIGPVPHTRGGSDAGEQRWRRFCDEGLSAYHRLRNDAAVEPPKGVSRLSAYLHYGFLSPLRIAREALERGGKGPEKYLDELIIWREVAYLYCFHNHRRIESLDALPAWAQETLDRHRHDPRFEVYSWERLARGQTGDEVWDLAQRSLLIHGELHNNLRMTWGKALLRWTQSPEDALRLLVDLNHRFALDGNDPASYGGLLWCLGLFDRPFTPEQPVLGSIRGRSTSTHRKRLDVAAFGRRILHPACGAQRRVAIVGAGLTGLVAGRILHDAGHDVRIFDKGRRPGGRLSTRQVRDDVLAFDHGAQYFTARNPGLRRAVDSWVDEGAVAPWRGRVVELQRGAVTPRVAGNGDDAQRFVGVPGMQSLAAYLARDVDVRCGVRIEAVSHVGGGFTLTDADGQTERDIDVLLITTPAPQAVPLLATSPALADQAKAVEMLPCWAVMVAFEQPLFDSDADGFDGAFVRDSPLAWVARDASKPGRAGETWVLHADVGWTEQHLDDDGDEAAGALLVAFFDALGREPVTPHHLRAHRWRYARPADPAGGVLWDPERLLGAGGDWSFAPRVEGAFLAGQALAGRVLGQLAADAADPRFEVAPDRGSQLTLELS